MSRLKFRKNLFDIFLEMWVALSQNSILSYLFWKSESEKIAYSVLNWFASLSNLAMFGYPPIAKAEEIKFQFELFSFEVLKSWSIPVLRNWAIICCLMPLTTSMVEFDKEFSWQNWYLRADVSHPKWKKKESFHYLQYT